MAQGQQLKALFTHRKLLLFPMPFLFIGALVNTSFADSLASPTMAMVFNVLMAIPVYIALSSEIGHTRATTLCLVLSAFAYGIESIGVLTAWPYGGFHYGTQLGPMLFGTVPLILPFTYVPLVFGAAALVRRLTARRTLRIWLAAMALVSFDLLLDPGATKLGFWIWHDPGVYYGVPSSNFLGWLLSSYLVMLILDKLAPKMLTFKHPYYVFTYVWGCVFWTFVALLNAMWLPCFMGIALLFACILWLRSRLPDNRDEGLNIPRGVEA